MKIAIISEILSTHSGSRAPVELAKHLSSSNKITLMAYSFRVEKEVKKQLEKRGVKTILIKSPKVPFGKWLAAFKFLSHLRGNDLISFHGTLPTFLIAKLSGIPLVKTYYGTQLNAYLERLLPNQKPNFKDKFLNWLGNQLILMIGKIHFRLADQVVGISQYTNQEAKRLYQKDIPFIYLGTDLGSSQKLKKVKPADSPVKILSVSRFTPYKGFHLLIKAFKKLNEEMPQLKLTLVGSTEKKEYLDYLVKIKNKNVEILTEISNQKLVRLYQESDIYATCDRWLFFGLPLAEAASFGKPAVALDFAAATEVIEHGQTGYVANSLASFANYLMKLTQDKNLRKNMGQRAKERVKKLFLWNKIAQKYEELFKDFLKKEKFKKKVRKPLRLPIFIALVISLIFGLPHLLAPLLLGGFENYKPLVINQVPLLTFEETWSYAAQTREVFDGHLLVSDYHLAEYKNLPPSLLFLSPLLMGIISRFVGSVETAFILGDFLLPPIIFLVIYFFLFKLTSVSLLSSLGGVLILTGNRLFQFIPPLTPEMTKALLNIFIIDGGETSLLEFSRLFHPQLVFVFLILHLYFLFLALREKSYFRVLLSSIFLGSLFYSYLYYWTFALAGEAVLLLVLLLQKNLSRAKTLASIIAFALILSLPYWLLFLNFQSLPSSIDILERMGLETGRIRNLARTIQYLTFAFIFFKLIKKKDFSFWFLLSFLIGGIISLNIQLFTGFTIQSWHWTIRAINPWSLIMLLYLLHQLLGRHRLWLPLLISLLVIFLLRGLVLQAVVAKNSYQGYTLPKTTLEAFAWLNQNTPNDSVVLTPSFETISLIPVYTHNNVFLPNGAATFASNEEIIQRLLITYKIFNLKTDDLRQILTYSGSGPCKESQNRHRRECLVDSELLEQQAVTVLFAFKYLKKSEGLLSWSVVFELPKETQQQILTAYDEFLKKPDLLPTNFRLDYIYYGPAEKRINKLDSGEIKKIDFESGFTKEVFRNQDIRIYEVLQ